MRRSRASRRSFGTACQPDRTAAVEERSGTGCQLGFIRADFERRAQRPVKLGAGCRKRGRVMGQGTPIDGGPEYRSGVVLQRRRDRALFHAVTASRRECAAMAESVGSWRG